MGLLKVRFLGSAILLSLGLTVASLSHGQGPLTPPGSPAPTMKSLQEVWDKVGTLQTQSSTQKFSFTAKVNANAGQTACTQMTITAGQTVKLESAVATTYFDAAAVAYMKPYVKTSSGGGQVMNIPVPTTASVSDPATAIRGGVIQIPFRLVSDFASAGIGYAYDFYLCVGASASAAAQANFIITGTYDSP